MSNIYKTIHIHTHIHNFIVPGIITLVLLYFLMATLKFHGCHNNYRKPKNNCLVLCTSI